MSEPTPKEIREAFSDYSQATNHIREQGKVDMRFVAGDPWEPEDRLAREEARRPCMAFDELGQYLNQAGNQIRQNKRAPQVIPEGDGANDKNAEKRANLIRGIDYRSSAQQSHITAFDNMIMRSVGYSRLTTQKVPGKTFDLELRIKPIENPDTIIFSPHYRMPDGSDVEEVFEIDVISRERFKKRFPKAKITSFSGEEMYEAHNWIREDDLQLAGYWKVTTEPVRLLLIDSPEGPVIAYEEEIKDVVSGRDKMGRFAKLRDQIKVLREMQDEKKVVKQYVTNGVEILQVNPWVGTRIPICGCFGKQLYADFGNGPKRHLMSMVRLARDPAMFMAYAISQEAEEMGMAPKAPFVGYKGQFESDAEAWEMLNKIPRAYVQADPVVDSATGQVLPLPTRPQFTPNVVVYEQAKESGRRSVQAAMGISQLPTAAQRQNEKSGIALDKIKTMEDIGAFHFVDNYDRYLQNMYWQVNEALDLVYDTARDAPIMKPDGSYATMRINDQHYQVQNPNEDVLHTGEGKYGVTISVGPSYQSEREEQSEFADNFLEIAPQLGFPPPIIQKIAAICVRMRSSLGIFGKELADIISPPETNNLPPEAQAAIAQLQAQMQQLQQENASLHMERAGKVLELANKTQIESMKGKHLLDKATMDFITQIVKAELAAKSKALDTQAQADAAKELAILGFQQDSNMAAHQAAHEQAMRATQPPPVTQPPPAAPTQPPA
ncbi:MAG TPA: portal protein [Acidobacteriaceae bacterium]|jgi:hypothetical protein|nr:portal protein [Acidobacteriaceae bacterium]